MDLHGFLKTKHKIIMDALLEPFYKNEIKTVKDCKHGEYVYNERAELCVVVKTNDPELGNITRLYSYCIETWPHDDTIVYPVTLYTQKIMEKMYAHRELWHKYNIMNGSFSRQLADDLHELMSLDPDDDDYNDKYDAFWKRLNSRLEEMKAHAEALGIIRK